MKNLILAALVLGMFTVISAPAMADHHEKWVTYDGGDGPGKGKHIVLLGGDEEYRSEEALPQLGKILSVHHGFKCTVLFSQNPETGEIDPNNQKYIPGIENIKEADLLVIFTRFRNLPDEDMKVINEYLKSGKPVIGMRTSTHGFQTKNPNWNHYSNGYEGPKAEWKGGFGRLVLGEKWINHHGRHGVQATLGLIAPGANGHPILNGIKDGDIFGPTDVYGVRLPLPDDSMPLVLGQVLSGMTKDSKPLPGAKNSPMMPVAWTKSYKLPDGKYGSSFSTTMGASQDMLSEGMRRLLVNATFHLLELEVPAKAKVDIVGEFKPTKFAFNGGKKGVKPADHKLKP